MAALHLTISLFLPFSNSLLCWVLRMRPEAIFWLDSIAGQADLGTALEIGICSAGDLLRRNAK